MFLKYLKSDSRLCHRGQMQCLIFTVSSNRHNIGQLFNTCQKVKLMTLKMGKRVSLIKQCIILLIFYTYLNYGSSDYNLKKNPKRKITKAKSSYLNKTEHCRAFSLICQPLLKLLFSSCVFSYMPWKCISYLLHQSTFIMKQLTTHKLLIPCQYETIWCQILYARVGFETDMLPTTCSALITSET